ncbi:MULTISPECIES: cytochrome-c peroxidase [Rhizobium/Agrobacterium group]|uniref:cytochrome-c peroxidase n=1 Tax=Rhizobium/Agrobacterium group TaxID=227290 RepID=UPI000B3FE5EA|nr:MULTISPECIES: cytochrome c peroxidase [Rhizobium/Agrobacterium group]MCF1482500.1 c-type cytochrome [Allorhizobium ampelinum]NSZ43859.1 c-type cytochrome [Agrobacterium vitis]NTA27607.1 c-type cytochrome [Allorhizobium ampelinum]OVE93965.1 cytochrome-c peroxidase [Allorhizobium ampelinum]
MAVFNEKSRLPLLALALLSLAFAGLGWAAQTLAETPTQAETGAPAQLSAVAQLGKALFFDQSLSGSGKMSCATCHDPAHHYAPANSRAVQMGGPDLNLPGIRPVPSLAYKIATPAFSVGVENAAEEAQEASPMAEASGTALAAQTTGIAGPVAGQPLVKAVAAADNAVPQGGMFWDGRADSLEDQALGPLLSPFEMANSDAQALYDKIKAGYGAQLTALFGKQVAEDQSMALSEIGFALARYQVEDPSFHSYSSKYDAYLRRQTQLTAAEQRGLALFDDPKKGNCASCHLDKMGGDGQMPAFTDYEFEALGVPRNPAIPANANRLYFDLGICGPMRHDEFSAQPQNCGLFKTPTLRNVAERGVYFHNGVYKTLEEATRFYVARDTDPASIYPKNPDGSIDKFNDMPEAYRGNIDVIDAPMDRKPGQPPALNETEIQDVVAFLKTLTDGWGAQQR